MKKTIFFILTAAAVSIVWAQDTTVTKTAGRKGWTFGVLPSFSYDADLGLQLGLLSNVYYFGDGTTYPEYLHSIYAEAATTSKHYGLFRLAYDSKYLIPDHRLSIDLSYLPDQMCDFYGFNGYQSHYNAAYTDAASDRYISRAYYKMKRDIFRFSTDLQGTIEKPWYWNVGLGLLYCSYGSVDVARLNKYAKGTDTLPQATTLYDRYVELGYIKGGSGSGFHPYLHGGLTLYTRDRQQNPRRGIHADAFFTFYGDLAPKEWANYTNVKFNFAWRHYVPLGCDRAVFAYRVGTQLNVVGDSPFYLNTYLNQLYMQRVIYEGLGGANSIRGILRNRIIARGVAFANAEFRFQVVRFMIGKEHFYIGLNPFMDAGMVVQPYDDVVSDPELDGSAVDRSQIYRPHLSAGCGLKVAMNENFVLSVDWAAALDKQDNGKMANIYVKMGYMF